ITAILTDFISPVVAAPEFQKNPPPTGQNYFSRQYPNPCGRKRTAQSPCGVQKGDRREVQRTILHHESGWQGWPSVSLRGMGADRAEIGRALHFQSNEEEVSGPGELLRADGRDGRSGQAV